MKGTTDLTKGKIMPTLMKLSLPIIATNFISTTYGLVDMIWVGRLGSGPVTAIGTASFFINLAMALATMITIGTGITYMTIGGLQGAIAAFFGQNYGARRLDRIQQGYQQALLLTSGFGIFISIIFIIFPGQLFSVFLSDEASLALGTDYMRIIGYSQLFMCMELMTVGAFNGIGKTHIPPIFSITFTALRIPLALILSEPYGLNGVWMSIALSSVFKGIVLVFWFSRTLRKMKVPQISA